MCPSIGGIGSIQVFDEHQRAARRFAVSNTIVIDHSSRKAVFMMDRLCSAYKPEHWLRHRSTACRCLSKLLFTIWITLMPLRRACAKRSDLQDSASRSLSVVSDVVTAHRQTAAQQSISRSDFVLWPRAEELNLSLVGRLLSTEQKCLFKPRSTCCLLAPLRCYSATS